MTPTTTKKTNQTNSKTTASQPSPILPNTQLDMVFPWEQVQPIFTQVRQKMAKQVKLDGFRQGKVPPQVAAQFLSPERIAESTAEELLKTTYVDFITKSGKHPLGRPEFTIVAAPEGKEWKIQVSIAEKPSLKLPELDKELQRIKKDRVKDAQNRRDAEKKSGEKKSSDSAQTSKNAQKTPSLDSAASEQIALRREAQEKERLLGFTYSQLILKYKPQVPELLVKQESEEQLHNFGHQLEKFKLTYQDYLRQRGQTEEEFMQEVTMSSLSRLQLAFLIDALIEEKHLIPDQKAIDTAIAADSEEAKKYYAENPEAKTAYAQRLAQIRLEELLLAE